MKGWHVIISHEDFVASKIRCISIDIHVSASLRADPMWKGQHIHHLVCCSSWFLSSYL